MAEQRSEVEQMASIFINRATLAVTIGNMLEFYDFITYGFFAIQIGHTFFPSYGQFGSLMLSLATFGAGFLTRPIGALVIGSYSDRAGRRPAMVLSFAMMGCAIVVLALTPSYDMIGVAAPIIVIAARMVQGFSLGGEVGPTTAYLVEAAPPGRRALAVSWQPASQQIASTAGAAVGMLLSSVMSNDALDAYGWRIAFLLGAICLPFGLLMRMRLPETLHLSETETPASPSLNKPSGALRGNARLIILGLLILASGTIITYVTQYMTTYAKNTLHVSSSLAFATSVVSNALGFVGVLWGGWLADRHGRWPVMVWPQLAALLFTYPVFMWIVGTESVSSLLVGFGLLSLIGSIPYTAFYAAFAEGLSKNIRGGTFAIVYAVAIAAFGGTAQLVVTWLLHITGNALAPAWYLIFATAVGLLAMIKMPETAPIKVSARASAVPDAISDGRPVT